MNGSKKQIGSGKTKNLDYYLSHLIKLNSHKIPEYDEPTKLSKTNNELLLTHFESDIKRYKSS